MKPIKLLVMFAVMCAPALASADYYGNGYDGHFHHRWGRLAWGFSLGLGGLHDNGNDVNCDNCSTGFAFEADAHIGGMLSNRFALLFEGQVNGRTVHADDVNGDTVLTQNVAMVAGQWWLLPQLWIKGGVGLADLQVSNDFAAADYGAGAAIMGAVGFEIFSARFFAVDLQARLIDGIYNGGSDHITAGNFGVGFNWY